MIVINPLRSPSERICYNTNMFGFTKAEIKIFRRLDTPAKIQDWLEKLPINFELKGETCMSPRRVLREHEAHCIEGAMFAATALRFHGHPPLLLDLKASAKDDDHVIAVFKQQGKWGAISQVNHNVLRYRDPVYRDIRELAMSYFHEYFLQNRRKSLRSYSAPIDLSRFDNQGWMTSDKNLWYIPRYLNKVRHYSIVSGSEIRKLRQVEPIEIKAGNIEHWPNPR